jgi:osmoprotectant transport system ATP-binding protein
LKDDRTPDEIQLIRFENVTRRYGAAVAVDDFSCQYDQGQTHILLGSSGCGKTTLLRLVLGMIAPDTGWVLVDGQPMSDLTRAELVGKMGYVVQEGGLFPHLTARENVAIAAEAQAWSKSRIETRVDELVRLVDLDDAFMRKFPHQLSGGQRQRVGLMRALMLDPPVLLLDEPLGSLDPLVRDDLQRELKEVFKALQKTVLFVTHDIREAAILGDTITLMTDGRLVQHGAFTDLTTKPAAPFVTAFLKAQKLPDQLQEFF